MKNKVHAVVWAVASVALCLPVWAAENGFPVPVDWSRRHLIITNAASPQQRLAASRDPRNISNWIRRTQAQQVRVLGNRNRERIRPRPQLDRDWSVSMGAGTVAPAMSPAKWGMATSSTLLIANCTTDWVVYGLNVAGSASQANLVFLRNLYSGSNGYCGAATIAASPSGAVRNASGVVTITTTAAHSFTVGMQVAIANVTDTSFNGTFTVVTASSTTFTYNTTNTTPSNSGGGVASFAQASVMAAYNVTTQAGGAILTSPSISLDGTKIAFVESTGSASIFHVLTLDPCTYSTAGCTNNGTSATSAAVPGTGNVASLVSIQYSTASNTRSSPWIDYGGNGTAYVGDDSGKLYRIVNLFAGTPALDTTFGGSGSITVSGAALLAPVLAQGWLLVGDVNGVLRAVEATSPYTVAASTVSVGTGMVDPPLVDASSTGFLSAFQTASGPNNFVLEQAIFTIASQTFTTQTADNIGHSSTFNGHAPTFDNNYYLGNITATTGYIYACGTLAGSQKPQLYRAGFTAGSPPAMSASPSSGATISGSAECSPLTEFANPNLTVKDLLFVGVLSTSNGAVQSYNISGAIPSSTTASASEPGGTSGIIVDTTQLANQQGSSIYFTTQSTTGGNCGAGNYCAIKLTQAGLQ